MVTKLTPYINRQGEARQEPTSAITASGTNPLPNGGVVLIGGGSATTVTLADPTKDGLVLEFITITAQAHVIDNSAGSGFNGVGAGSDVATGTAAIGNSLRVISYNGAWYVANNVNFTLA